MNAERPLYGLVLAGGRSRRMGADKAGLIHPDGRPLAKRAIDLLKGAGCDRIMLSIRYDQDVPPMVEPSDQIVIIRDPEGGSDGPQSGMLAAMRANPESDWVVIACDLPRLNVATLRNLVESRYSGEVFLSYRSEFDGLPEPLCAFYASEALAILEQAESNGFNCPRKVLIQNQCRLLEPATPRALENANTPEDWQTANMP